jgi:Family of unknown function (DUF6011)
MIPDIFHCQAARLHTLPNAPTLRTANHEQLVEHSHHLEVLNADKIEERFGTDPENDDEDGYKFFTHGCHAMLEQEDYWRQCNLVWAWIDERPVWTSPIHWTCGEFGILPEPGRPTTRRFRLSLLGGGQIRITETFEPMSDNAGFICYHPELRVTADAGNGLQRFTGIIDGVVCEMSAKAALFLPGTPQSVANRVASTFRLLTSADATASVRDPDPDNFMALLDRSEQCCCCGRALRDHVSTLLGIGPDCAKQQRLPHGLGIANKILQRRRELLGDAVAPAEVLS